MPPKYVPRSGQRLWVDLGWRADRIPTAAVAALTSLSLTSTTLASFTPHAFPSLTTLSLTNTDATFLRKSLLFPALRSLEYHNALLDTDELPVLRLNAFAHAGPHLLHLSVGRMFDPASDVQEGRAPPSLAPFVRLSSLTLLADSSHRAKAYFPLLVRVVPSRPSDSQDYSSPPS